MANVHMEKEAQRRELIVRMRAQKPTGVLLKIAADRHNKQSKKLAQLAEEEENLTALLLAKRQEDAQVQLAMQQATLELDELVARATLDQEELARAPVLYPWSEWRSVRSSCSSPTLVEVAASLVAILPPQAAQSCAAWTASVASLATYHSLGRARLWRYLPFSLSARARLPGSTRISHRHEVTDLAEATRAGSRSQSRRDSGDLQSASSRLERGGSTCCWFV